MVIGLRKTGHKREPACINLAGGKTFRFAGAGRNWVRRHSGEAVRSQRINPTPDHQTRLDFFLNRDS